MSGSLGLQPDTSIYQKLIPQAQPQQSPLAVMGQVQGIVGQGIQNQQNIMQMKARQAMGPILQQSVGPDGQIDWDKAVVNMAAHPETAWMAGDVLNQAIQRKLTQTETAGKALEQAQTQYKAFGNAAAGLLPLGNNVTQGDVFEAVSKLVGGGLIPRDKALEYLSNLPSDGTQLHNHLQRFALMAQGATEAFKNLYGTITPQDVGGRTAMVQNIPMFGSSQEVGSIGKTPTPGEYYAGQPQVGPSGEELVGPKGPAFGMPAPGQGASSQPPTGLGGSPNGPAGLGLPPQSGVAPVNPTNSSPMVMTKPGISFGQYLNGQGTTADYEKNLNHQVSEGQNALQSIQEIGNLMQTARTGGGAEFRTRLAQLAEAAGLPQDKVNSIQGGSGDALADAQALMKLFLRNAVQVLGQDMQGNRKTQGEVDLYTKQGSPNLDMTPGGIQKILAFTSKLLKQTVTEQQIFNEYKGNAPTDANGKFQYSPRFSSNPEGWFPYWSGIKQKLYQNGPMYRDINQAAREAFPQAFRGGQ